MGFFLLKMAKTLDFLTRLHYNIIKGLTSSKIKKYKKGAFTMGYVVLDENKKKKANSISLPNETWQLLDRMSADKKVSRSQLIYAIIEAYCASAVIGCEVLKQRGSSWEE